MSVMAILRQLTTWSLSLASCERDKTTPKPTIIGPSRIVNVAPGVTSSYNGDEICEEAKGGMMKRGKCELCHAVADLRDSHYLPKSGYKKMRASDLKNPNPVVLSGGKAKQSSLQVRDYKFCGACEERFNKGGEAWILNKTPPPPLPSSPFSTPTGDFTH